MFNRKFSLVLTLIFMLSGIGWASPLYAPEYTPEYTADTDSQSLPETSSHDWYVPTSLYGKPLEAARARLVTGVHEGAPVMALRLEMAAGWHSYWYFPGSAGIAPAFEWSSSSQISAGEPLYLPPKRFNEPSGPTYGYDGETVIFVPFMVKDTFKKTAETALHFDFTLTLGLCKEICVPASFTFSERITRADINHSSEQIWLNEALSALPKPADDNLFVKEVLFSENVLQVSVAGVNLTQPEIFIAGRDGDFFDMPEIVSTSPNLWVFKVSATPFDGDFIGRALEFIVQEESRSISQIRHVQPKKSVYE